MCSGGVALDGDCREGGTFSFSAIRLKLAPLTPPEQTRSLIDQAFRSFLSMLFTCILKNSKCSLGTTE